MVDAGLFTYIRRGCYSHIPGVQLPPPSVVCLHDTLYGFPVKICQCHASLCNNELLEHVEPTASTTPKNQDGQNAYHNMLEYVFGTLKVTVTPTAAKPCYNSAAHERAGTIITVFAFALAVFYLLAFS